MLPVASEMRGQSRLPADTLLEAFESIERETSAFVEGAFGRKSLTRPLQLTRHPHTAIALGGMKILPLNRCGLASC
jgi:hypothetical protein